MVAAEAWSFDSTSVSARALARVRRVGAGSGMRVAQESDSRHMWARR